MSEIELGKMISKNLQLYLTKKNMSIPELAKQIGFERTAVNNFLNRLEEGKATIKTICKYANALEVDPALLFKELELKPKGE